MSKVLIIGNGFDLDLGLKTRYIDFWRSDIFEEYRNHYSYGGLVSFLNSKANDSSTWFDIESLLREFVHLDQNHSSIYSHVSENEHSNTKEEFEKIRESLSSYLEVQVSHQKLNESSAAAQVLRAFVALDSAIIYTFNYTDLYKIAEKLLITEQFDYKDVHGRSSNKSLILGINDEVDVVNNYEFAYKTFSPYYHSVPLKFDLEEANDVIIFGLAMGDIDYPYFQDFFRKLCAPENSRKNAKRVTIFTYDEASRMNILRQLRAMNEKRVNYMFGQNQFEFIRTGVESDKYKLTRFLRRLTEEVKEKQKHLEHKLMMS